MAQEHLFQQTFEIKGGDFNGAGRASGRLRGILKQIGVSAGVVRRVAVAAYEAEINVVIYARRGWLSFVITPQKITVVVEDQGEGIPDVDLAMQEGYSTASSEIREMGFGTGMGLPNIRRNVDELDIHSVVGRGTKMQFTVNM
jgi:serine/threonine-protein kinase RsbT